MSPALELRGVTRVFGAGETAFTALSGASLGVDVGELVAIMGPSGSGKSTLLALAGGLDVPTSGSVLVAGTDLSQLSRDERSKLRRSSIGYVFQELNLLSSLTAAENVAMPLELDGTRASRARRIAIAALGEVGIGSKAGSFPDELSGGERQRVAIARALVGERSLLLADEPTGALDSVNGEEVMRILRNACDEGASGVIVTHDAQLAAWADRVVFIRDGVITDTTRPPAGPESLIAVDGSP